GGGAPQVTANRARAPNPPPLARGPTRCRRPTDPTPIRPGCAGRAAHDIQVAQPMNWLREPDSEPIPGYRLIEPIGTGGFGEVWKCVAPGGIHKAIKFVYGNLNSLDADHAPPLQHNTALQ